MSTSWCPACGEPMLPGGHPTCLGPVIVPKAKVEPDPMRAFYIHFAKVVGILAAALLAVVCIAKMLGGAR